MEEPKWEGPFNPTDIEKPFNVLFIRDVENGIEISGNFGKRGYETPVEDIKTYILPSVISIDVASWRATEKVATNETVLEEIEGE